MREAQRIFTLFHRLAPDLRPASKPAKSREEEPLVSVIVPNYNHEKYLPERLRSITGQTHENMEIITWVIRALVTRPSRASSA